MSRIARVASGTDSAARNHSLRRSLRAIVVGTAALVVALGTSTAYSIDVTTEAELRQAIWHERRVELALEFDRYFDVIRQGRGQEIFGPLGWQPHNEVWPIPQREIDLSAGVLEQNPGYGVGTE